MDHNLAPSDSTLHPGEQPNSVEKVSLINTDSETNTSSHISILNIHAGTMATNSTANEGCVIREINHTANCTDHSSNKQKVYKKELLNLETNCVSDEGIGSSNCVTNTPENDLIICDQTQAPSKPGKAIINESIPDSQISTSSVANFVNGKSKLNIDTNNHGDQHSQTESEKRRMENIDVSAKNSVQKDICENTVNKDTVTVHQDFRETMPHSLDVIVEEQGESSDANSDSSANDNHTGTFGKTDTIESVDRCKLSFPHPDLKIETSNVFEKCHSLEDAETMSETSSNSMLKKTETDSEKDIGECLLDTAHESDNITYHETTASTGLLHETNSLDNTYCETAFRRSDADCQLNRWNSKNSHSRHSRDRKESLEQKLKRRFTIHDEHKQEVAKRIIALVIKYSLFVFNFCSWVVAAIAIGLGLWVLTDKGQIVSDGSDFFLDPSIMTCIVGGITFVVAFLGCVGALRENLLLLKVFFIVLGIIVVIEVIIAITVFVMYTVPEVREKFLRSTPENILRRAIERYMDDSDIQKWIDFIQQEFRCCGIGGVEENNEGFRDWQINSYFNCTPSNKSIYRCAVPTSCCIFEKGDRVNIMCGFEMSNQKLIDVRDYIFTRGCIHGFGEWLSKYDELIVISALTTLIMQFLAVISAKIMIRRIEKRRRRWGRLVRSSTSTSS